MENDKILKAVPSKSKNSFRVLLLHTALIRHSYYKEFIILRIMR
jgi:hypothetical protein